ncbi:MAG: hypothetical protein PGN13_02495 [Patulibacter minatonensis]
MSITRTACTLAAAVAASLAIAAPASADSFVYLKGGDVYLTTTDIARQFRVTSTGGYTAVSQSDDGTILATTASKRLRRLDRMGNVLSDIGTIAGGTSGTLTFKGPFDADVSPNGQRAAYGYLYTGYTSTGDGTWVNEGNATAFTRAASETSSGESGFRTSREYDAPEWVDDQRVLASNGPGWPSDPVAIVEAGSGSSRSWFTDPQNPHPHDATLSRNWRMLAMTNADRTQLHVYRDQDGLLLGAVNPCFFYSQDHQVRFSSPTFNRDATLLAWADGQGLEIAPIGNTAAGCPDGVDSELVLPGASSPDWGPAGVPTSRPTPTATPTPAPTATPSPTAPPTAPPTAAPTPSPAATATAGEKAGPQTADRDPQPGTPVAHAENRAPRPSLSLVAIPIRLSKALSGGLPTTVQAPAAGAVTVTAKFNGKLVATGTAKTKSAGLMSLKLRFTKAAKNKLLKSRRVTLEVSARQGDAEGSVTITLKR